MTIAPQSRRNFLALLLGLVGVRQSANPKHLCGSRRLWRVPVTFFAGNSFAKFDSKPLQIIKIDHEHKVITLG